MKYKMEQYETGEYYGELFYFIKIDKANKYMEVRSKNTGLMGVILNNQGEVIGINIHHGNNIYSPTNLRKILQTEVNQQTGQTNNKEEESIIKWWNNKITTFKMEQKTMNSQEELTRQQLDDYFTKTEQAEMTTYHINPPIQDITVQIGEDTKINYEYLNIEQIILLGEGDDKLIYFTNNKPWLEDIDISTSKDWKDIHFIFDKEELYISSTKDNVKQLYVELYDKLNPYKSPVENDKVINEFLQKRQKIQK